MSWLKLDDGADEHPKITALSDGAFRLWASGLCYCGRQLTDGVIHVRQVARLTMAEDWRALLKELTTPQVRGKAPLWELSEDGQTIQVHDYLEYNPSAHEVLAERYTAKERMRVVRALRRLGLGDRITPDQWEDLPNELKVHFHKGRDGMMERQRNGGGPAVQANSGANVHANVPAKFGDPDPSRPDPSRPPEERREPPVVPRQRGTAADDGDGLFGEDQKGTASWAVKAKRPKGVTPRDLEAVVVRCLREIRQAPVMPDRCNTAAQAVLSLWRALGNPDVHQFGDDLVLVARAAQMSAEKIFARDVRAEGWKDGTDRTFHVVTLCRHDRWDDRLRTAQKWAADSGRVGPGGVAVAKRERWMDPGAPSSWQGLDAPTTMQQVYLGCARRLFEAELAGDALAAALGKLEAHAARPGSGRDLDALVRMVLDEVGLW